MLFNMDDARGCRAALLDLSRKRNEIIEMMPFPFDCRYAGENRTIFSAPDLDAFIAFLRLEITNFVSKRGSPLSATEAKLDTFLRSGRIPKESLY